MSTIMWSCGISDMCFCSENDISGILHNSFVVDHDHFGKLTAHELKPGGKDILVTEENKEDYVRLYVQWRLHRGTLSQFSSLVKGFHELVPCDMLKGFDEKELEVHSYAPASVAVTCGVPVLHQPAFLLGCSVCCLL